MANTKKSFRSVPAAELTKRYQNISRLFAALHALTGIIVVMLIALASAGKISWLHTGFFVITAVMSNWLIAAVRKLKQAEFSSILNTDCNPQKFYKVFAPLDRKPDVFTPVSLNVLRALFYQGQWQEALRRLEKMSVPKENTPAFYQYYNVLANCCEQGDDVERLYEIQRKIQMAAGKLKPRSHLTASSQQLLSILNIMILRKEGQITQCKDACKEMYDRASFALSRINVSLRLAQLEYISGSHQSAATRCEYIIDDGGTTVYADEAKELYQKCCGHEYVPYDTPRDLPSCMADFEDDELREDDDDNYDDDIDDAEDSDNDSDVGNDNDEDDDD